MLKVIKCLLWVEVLVLQWFRASTTHVNMGIPPRVNVVESTMTSRLGEFFKMNALIFLGYKFGENPQEFLDGVYKVLSAMG